MPFGPVNGPQMFITFIHDMDSTWKIVAESKGVKIGDDTNTRIIVDDILSWASMLKTALLYMECQLRVCLSQNLSLSLKKTHIFPVRMEFIGIDVSEDGNRPAMSKHQLLRTWPDPLIVRDIASLIGFAIFYSSFIPHFEVCTKRLHEITKLVYSEPVARHFDKDARAEWVDIKRALLLDRCMMRFDNRRFSVLTFLL